MGKNKSRRTPARKPSLADYPNIEQEVPQLMEDVSRFTKNYDRFKDPDGLKRFRKKQADKYGLPDKIIQDLINLTVTQQVEEEMRREGGGG